MTAALVSIISRVITSQQFFLYNSITFISISIASIPVQMCIRDRYNTANRSLRIKFAHEKRREGLTISDIALLLHSSPKTIQKYLAIPEDQIPAVSYTHLT